MATVASAVGKGMQAIGVLTLAACVFAKAPMHVWVGMGIIFIIGAVYEILYEILVAPHLHRKNK